MADFVHLHTHSEYSFGERAVFIVFFITNYYNGIVMDDIREEVKLLVAKIVDSYKPEKVILFGSLARGEIRDDSDIDLLIIKNSDKKRPFRIKDVFVAIRGLDRSYSLDALVYTPEELEKRVSLGDYFINRVLAEGKVLYGRS